MHEAYEMWGADNALPSEVTGIDNTKSVEELKNEVAYDFEEVLLKVSNKILWEIVFALLGVDTDKHYMEDLFVTIVKETKDVFIGEVIASLELDDGEVIEKVREGLNEDLEEGARRYLRSYLTLNVLSDEMLDAIREHSIVEKHKRQRNEQSPPE